MSDSSAFIAIPIGWTTMISLSHWGMFPASLGIVSEYVTISHEELGRLLGRAFDYDAKYLHG